jgi:hypothetical protein
MIRRS